MLSTISKPTAVALFFGGIGLHRAALMLRSSHSTTTSAPPAESSSSKRVKSSVYTKTGDKGLSSLYNGERRSKTDMVFEALGNQDELNAVLGLAVYHCKASNNGLDDILIEIQSRLFDLGAAVATPVGSSSTAKTLYTRFPKENTDQVESWIDELDIQLPPLMNFVIPSGGLSSLHLNHARTVCRRAERSVVPLTTGGTVDVECGRYLNRLSDLFFVCSRIAASREKTEEIIWRKAAPQ